MVARFRKLPCLFPALVVVMAALSLPTGCRADGCIIKKLGHYVSEAEQRAFIEWTDGHEHLFIQTLAERSSEPTLWIVPIPANPAAVEAEPAETFPHVVHERSLVGSAQRTLLNTLRWTAVLDTGGLFCPLQFAGCSKSKSEKGNKSGDGVDVYQHVEKLGMIVETITAKTPDTLDRYLKARRLAVRAEEISALRPYLGKEFTLVCGWAAKGSSLEARALQVAFPYPRVFYPLRPSQVYTSDLPTAVYVRGLASLPNGPYPAGTKLRYVSARIADEDDDGTVRESVTRVQLPSSPKAWTEDLILEPGAPPAIHLADCIDSYQHAVPWVIRAVLGAALASFLPWVVVSGRMRQGRDFGWAVTVGGLICLSIYASAFIFYVWCRTRILPADVMVGKRWLWVVLFAGVHLAATAGVCSSLMEWLRWYR